MRVFITGGVGLIGRAIATHLMAQGHEVHLTDLVPETDVPHTRYSVCDILNFEALCEQMRGNDAVVHMAALRNPLTGPNQDVFRINTAGTFNVFEAASRVGIRRVVQASSINAIGCAWNTTDFNPVYLLVDEDHPSVTSDAYSLSKIMVEQVGDYFWRRDGIESVALRFPGIYRAEQKLTGSWGERRRAMRAYLDEFVQIPPAEQRQQIAAVRQRCVAFRAERRLEYPNTWKAPDADGMPPLLVQAYMFDRANLWASLEDRDAAVAVEQALVAPLKGSHALFVNSSRNSLNYESQTLAQLFFPEARLQRPLSGAESLVSIQRARDLIGFEPVYSLQGE